jgi:hypothetical protein
MGSAERVAANRIIGAGNCEDLEARGREEPEAAKQFNLSAADLPGAFWMLSVLRSLVVGLDPCALRSFPVR